MTTRFIYIYTIKDNTVYIKRTNHILEKSVVMTYPKRERLAISTRYISVPAANVILKIMRELPSLEGTIVNMAIRFSKGGYAHIRIGSRDVPGIIISIPDAGSYKQLRDTLLAKCSSEELRGRTEEDYIPF